MKKRATHTMFHKEEGFAFLSTSEGVVAQNDKLNQELATGNLYQFPSGIKFYESTMFRNMVTLFSLAESISGWKIGYQPKLAASAWCVLTLSEPVPKWQKNFAESEKYYFTLLNAEYTDTNTIQSILDAHKLNLLLTQNKEYRTIFPYLASLNYIYRVSKRQLKKIATLLSKKGDLFRDMNWSKATPQLPSKNLSSYLLVSRLTGVPIAERNMMPTVDSDMLASLVAASLMNLKIYPMGVRPGVPAQSNGQGIRKSSFNTVKLELETIELFIGTKKINIKIIESEYLLAILYETDPNITYNTWKEQLEKLEQRIEEFDIDITGVILDKNFFRQLADEYFNF